MPDKGAKKGNDPIIEQQAGVDNRRDNERRTVLWPAILHVEGYEFNCQIKNFSMGGVKLKFNLPLKEGTKVKVEIPRRNISLRAEIVWQSKGLLGIQFHENDSVIHRAFGERAKVMGIAGTRKVGVLGKASG